MAKKQPKKVEALRHREAARKHIPTAEYRAVLADEDRSPVQVAYERRNRDLDPQFVWRGKDQQDEQDLTVQAPPLYIQEKVQPKVLIDDLARHSKAAAPPDEVIDLFADFNGLPEDATATEFYEHDANWSNRMILGDSLQVMASLAEREDLRGKVQCIYLDPPYGIKFNSNFQWSTTSRNVTDGRAAHITREPEQVKAFRDTWRDGIHSYLTYLRDRLSVAHDLLTADGSIFVQIGDENVHRVRSLLDEVFGPDGYVSLITYKTSIGLGSQALDNTCNYLIWYCKNKDSAKFRRLYRRLEPWKEGATRYKTIRSPDLTQRRVTKRELLGLDALRQGARLFRDVGLTSRGASRTTVFPVQFGGDSYRPSVGGWRTSEHGMRRVVRADRVMRTGRNLSFRKYFDDFSAIALDSFWVDVSGGITSRTDPKIYVVQTSTKVVERCLLMATDPGDLVLDPTCGAGTTAYVAEHWGRRWVTIDTSRVALALARSRIMGARYPYYLLADSPAGVEKEAEISRTVRRAERTFGDIRQGFVYERVPHITLRVIANNSEIDVIWEQYQETLEPLREKLNALVGTSWEEWEIPRRPEDSRDPETCKIHAKWWKARIARQKEIDASIAAYAPFEYLYDKPYEDKKIVRVAGPFTVESLSPHRVLGVDAEDQLLDRAAERPPSDYGERQDFASMILDQLRTAGVQQAHKSDRIDFTSVTGWPGDYVCAMGQYMEAGRARRAGILIGPEFGTVSRPDLVAAAKEAAEAGFDSVIACAFNYDARSADFVKVGRVPTLKARMNADLHMADELKNTGAGNLFVIFGEPDIDIQSVDDGQIQVEIKGVDVFDPGTGEVRSDDTDGIACWFIDTDYNEESFFVRHAYFLGVNDPYKALKTTLKAEIDPDAWATLRSNVSRPFPKPESGRIAVKVINHLGDEVMKVFRV